MIKDYWEQILKNIEVRQNLSKIRQEIKGEDKREIFLNLVQEKEAILLELLKSEDAKTRKNVALLMGDLVMQRFLTPLWEAYQNESQRFVKSAYLTALGNLDYREYLTDIEMRLELLGKEALTDENRKHITEEMRELSALIVRLQGIRQHQFTGWNEEYDIVLLTNRNHGDVTSEELKALEPGAVTKAFNAGIMARVGNLKWMKDIRTYQELLFLVKGMTVCPMEPEAITQVILKSDLLSFLTASHDEAAPFYFRIEMKSPRDLKQRSLFVKKLSAQIERASNRQLINTTENYEVEIRLIENSQGNCNILIKLFTLKDKRFAYREVVLPTSIRPVNAALTVALAKEYLQEGAQILDPFCGAGTMLIERKKAVKSSTAYGLDIQEEAVLKARKNTENANQHIYYINRDFFSFQHDYQFDEVITNMPFQIGRINEDEIYDIYVKFFKTIPKHLQKGAILVLYSHNKEYIKALTARTDFQVLKEYEISRREGTYVFILKYM